MNKETKILIAKTKATEILIIKIAGLDKERALSALESIEGQYKTDHFVLRDMISTDHEPLVYFKSGNVAYSHKLKNGIITIYKEEYKLI